MRRAAVFLACVGNDAYQLFQMLDFETDKDRQSIDKVIDAFKRYCISEVKITYERYVFNCRVQEVSETFDAFMADIRRLARSCEFVALEESILRDRIVISVLNDAMRCKLLQTRKLDLALAVDICKASEVSARQLRAMTSPDDVTALQHSLSPPPCHDSSRHRPAGRSGSRYRYGRSTSSRRESALECLVTTAATTGTEAAMMSAAMQ